MILNDEHYKIFENECLKWVKFFHLYDWKLIYHMETLGDLALAEIRFDTEHKSAIIVLNQEWEDFEFSIEQLKRSAFHEVSELLLTDVRAMLDLRCRNKDELINTEVHRVIRRLENSIFEKELEK